MILPTTGATGVDDKELITTFPDVKEVHPKSFAMVKVYVPGISPVTVVLIPVPFVTVAPGVLISVQVPVAGKPFITTLPVATEQVG